MRAVCVGDRWRGPDDRVWRIVEWGSDVKLRRDGQTVYVPHKVLEHEAEGWAWLRDPGPLV